MLQNEYLVAKIGVDTAENELSKVDQLHKKEAKKENGKWRTPRGRCGASRGAVRRIRSEAAIPER